MGSIGFPEMLVIFVVALLVFGPKRLPELGRSLGRGLSEFKKATNGLKESIQREIESASLDTSTRGSSNKSEAGTHVDAPKS
jgi:sec-independent protein translocase protein TatA